jgi:hypothetical protein
MPCPSHPPSLDHSNYTWRRVQVMKLLIVQFPQTTVTSSLFGPNILLSTLPSNTLSLCSSLKNWDQDSPPHINTGKIIVFYILILKVLYSRQKDKGFWTAWLQALPEFNLLLISSWIRFSLAYSVLFKELRSKPTWWRGPLRKQV